MPAEMEFGLLGPLVVQSDGAAVPVTASKQRAVLAVLLLNAGRLVSLDQLIEALWGARPPRTARESAQNYVMRLRNALGDEGRARILTLPGGYVIRVADGELDVSRFQALLEAARAAAQEQAWEVSATRAGEALSIWRGEPLADAGSEMLALRQVPRLAEMRQAAVEARVEARLHLGRYAGLVAELRQLTAEHPLRERLHGLLMVALCQEGRQGEAMQAYQQARRMLVEELGAEPGVALRELHQRILTGDPTLNADAVRTSPAPAEAGGPDAVVPRQLPAGVRHFTGRADELAMLTRLLKHSRADKPGTLSTSVISGTAGVGKTALAVRWAHQVADRFPDGQLFVNLHGFDSGRPVAPADALAGFLRALGVPGSGIPAEAEERAARYRSMLAGRRMLVVVDNAESAAQVRPLLPGSSTCAAIVTSRDPLAGLVVRDGATRVSLDLLPHDDAVSLLTALIGERADADPDAATTLAAQCCRLPLALRVAAELAVARADAPLAELVAELADRKRRLKLLDADGDPNTAVPVVFSWSYQHLAADAARAFRLVGLYPGPYIDRYGAAALTATTHERAGQLLDTLARAHLIQPTRPSRHDQYEMHDLLRAYAAGQAAAHDGPDGIGAALTRLLDHYLHTAADAMDTLYPAECHRRPRIPGPASATPPMTDPAAARGWLDTHRAVLVAAAVRAADDGWPGHSTRLSATLYEYLDSGSYLPEAMTIHSCARSAARHAGDQTAEAEALFRLGRVDWRLGCYRRAARHFRQALTMFRKVGDQVNAAYALTHLGRVDWREGRYLQATRRQQQALNLFRHAGDRTGEAYALVDLARVDWRLGRFPDAITHYRQALALFQQTGDRNGEARALGSLGEIDVQQGRYPQARTEFRQARILFRETGDRTGEACALGGLGEIDLRQRRYPQAARHLRQALTIFQEVGDQIGEAQVRNSLGEVLLATGRSGDARTQHATALTLASQVGDIHQQARAHCGLGHANYATGDAGQARHHWQHALTCYTSLGSPEADQVRASLGSLGPAT